MNPMKKTTRRRALKNASKAFAFTFIPSYLATGVRAQGDPEPPSKRINLACVGVGGRAGGVIPSLCNKGNAVPVALCDIDFNHRRQGKVLQQFPEVERFADYRVMLEKMGKDIDAVSVVTPDHSHFGASILAMSMGKHVYVEKPLTHSFDEAQKLIEAEQKFQVVTQMGNQGHTGLGPYQFQEWMKRGVIKDVREIHAWKGPGLFFMNASERFNKWPAAEEVPKNLNWDLWCGPAPKRPYTSKLHPFNWRGFYDYGCGMLGDWGAHIIDYVHDYLELGLPTKIEAVKIEDPNDIIFPLSTQLTFTFPERSPELPEVKLHWRDGGTFHPEIERTFWDGEEAPNLGGAGTFFVPDGGKADYAVLRGSHSNPSRIMPHGKTRDMIDKLKVDKPDVPGHQESFIQACMGNGKTWSPFSVAGPLTQVLNLGCIAQYLNESLAFDPQSKTFKNNAKATALLKTNPRAGWEDLYKII